MYVRQIFGGSTPPIYMTDVCPSNIWGVHTPKVFDGCMSIKYFGGLHLQNIQPMYVRLIFGGSTPPKNLMDVCP